MTHAPEPAPAPKSQDAPFFPEGAAIRRVHREAIVLLGGGRALLMQVAHPAVAAGVAAHSSFREGRSQRLLRTLRPTLAIVFGTQRQAREAAASINAVHGRVNGPGYDAQDPALLFWVLATLIDTALLMHERFLRPLPAAEAEAYYQDMLTAGALLGVRREHAPVDLAAFRAYMAGMLPHLDVGNEAREIARGLFGGDGLAALEGFGLRQLTAALLPVSLHRAYGLSWPPAAERILGLASAASRALLPRAPLWLRATPRVLLPPRASR